MAVMQPNGDNDPRKQKEAPRLQTATLMSILDFGQRDLEANQRGQVTQQQKKKLQADLDDDRDGLALLMTVLLGVTLLLALITLSSGIPLTAVAIGGAVILIPLMIFAYARQGNKQTDLEDAQVESVMGRAQVYGHGAGGTQHAILRVEGKTFPIDYEQLRRLQQHAAPVIRAYYTAESGFLLSAEVVHYEDEKRKNDLDEKPKRDIDVDEDIFTLSGRNYDERKK